MADRTPRFTDALEMLSGLALLADEARDAGWEVNLAAESSDDAERVTFSAALTRKEPA